MFIFDNCLLEKTKTDIEIIKIIICLKQVGTIYIILIRYI